MYDKSAISKLSFFVTNHPWWVLLLLVPILFGLSAGIINLGFKNDYRAYFSKDNPQLLAFESIQATYSKSDNILFIVEPVHGNVFNPKVLDAIQQLTKEAWQLPFSSRVDSVTNFQHTVAKGDELIVADLVANPASLTDSELQTIKQAALNEPLLVNRLISNTGHVAGVNVTLQLPEKDPMESIEAAKQARALATSIEARHPGIKLQLTGIVMMSNAFAESAMSDNVRLVPIMYGIILLVSTLSLRSVTAVIGVVLLIVFSMTSAIGIFGWFGMYLTPTSAVAPTVILTIAVADSIHLLAGMLNGMRNGHEKKQAIRDSLEANFQPILLTNLTTLVGFLTMNFSDAPPFRDLGNIAALGVLTACMLTVSFLPALMMVLPVRVKLRKVTRISVLGRLSLFVIRHRFALISINTVIVILFTYFASFNELDDDFVKYFDKTVEFRRATDFFSENMGGLDTIEFSVQGKQEGAVNDPVFLQHMEEFSIWLRQQPEVKHINSVLDTLKRLNKSMHGDDPAWYQLPGQRELAAQYLLMYEMSLPYGLDLNDQLNVDKSGMRVIVTLNRVTSNQLLDVESRVNAWLHQHMPDIKVEVASTALMFAHIGKRNTGNMILGSSFELAVISIILITAFRSLRLGLISLIPNLVPAGIAFGIWGLIDGRVGLGLSVVASITFGIVIDDTIHFISKYRRGRTEKGLNSEEAILYASSSVGEAIWMTSSILVSGFVVLSFSHFAVNSGMGLLSAITITVALVMDLLFLPPLLMMLDKK
ncbi:MAG: MMPL family transporter [Methylococcaceae bacterium]|nr:MMPL family transporter [Methylococcaceae bacterium]